MWGYAFTCFHITIFVLMNVVFCEIFAEKNAEHFQYSKPLIFFWIVCNYLIAWGFTGTPVVKVILTILGGVVFLRCLFYGSLRKLFALNVVYYALFLAIEYLTIICIGCLFVDGSITKIENGYLSYVAGGISNIVVLFVVTFLSRVFAKESRDLIKEQEWLVFSTLPIFTIIADVAFLLNFDEDLSKNQQRIVLMVSFGMLLINIILFFMIRNINERELREKQYELLSEQSRNIMKLYDEISANMTYQRSIVHDYKNQLLTLKVLCEENEHQELREYLAQLENSSVEYVELFDTNHPVINAVLNSKYHEAQKKDIVMIVKANDLSGIPVDPTDMVVILSNILDNAIEASEKIAKEERMIKLKVIRESESIILSAVNHYDGKLQKNGKKILTSKNDRGLHGIGLNNIRMIAEKYKGTCLIQPKEKEFKITTILPISTVCKES